jgi:hypothetical protein
MSEKKELITSKQLAERWGMSPGTLENWRGKRKGPNFIKLGKGRNAQVLYRLRDVEEFESQNTVHIKDKAS